MRWNISDRSHCDGDKRVVTRFLLFPLNIGTEVRWLCSAKILQEYSSNYAGSGWDNIQFV
jgi:hypothetical protein